MNVPLIIVDDTRTDSFTFGPPDWTIDTLNPWFNGTGHVSPKQSTGQLSMTFNGTSVAFFGITPPQGSQIFTVSIDGSEPSNTSYNDPNPPSYRQWYQSPTLAEGSHNISLSLLNGTALDFAVVTPGNDTPLEEQMVIVDSENPAITFQGNWSQNKALFNSSQIPDGLPFQNTTQDSTTIGDNLTFLFTGQSAAIYGVFNWSTLGLITLSFNLDGSLSTRTFQVTSTTSQFQSHLGQQPNMQFFLYNFIPPGNHTLVVTVTECVNQTFSFDYITFEPSFSTLATMPNLTSLTVSGDSNSSQSLSNGAIVGIVIVVIVVVTSCVAFVQRMRRKKKRSSDNLVGVNPFIPTRSNNTGTFRLNSRLVASAPAISNNAMRNASNNYTPVRVVDPDAPGRPNTTPQAGLAVADGEHDIMEDVPPSYDESNRMNS